MKLPGCLEAAFVRSPFAHARIRSIDGTPAAALHGVVAVLTAAELDLEPIQELPILAPRPALPAHTVRFVGEPVAVVLAETLEAAADAAQLVQVEWEPLPPVLDPADGEEVRADRAGSEGDPLEGAQVVVRGRFVNQRLAPLPMDPNANAGAYPAIGALLPGLTGLMAAGVYRMPKVDFLSSVRLTNTTPLHAYRGAGRPEAAAMVERAMDMLAAELSMDSAGLRRRNLLQPDEFPKATVTGATYGLGELSCCSGCRARAGSLRAASTRTDGEARSRRPAPARNRALLLC